MKKMTRSMLLIGPALYTLTMAAGCGSEGPQETYEEICRKATAGDWRVVYDSHCRQAKATLDGLFKELLADLARGPNGPADVQDARKRWPTTRHYFTDAIAHDEEAQKMFIGAKVLETKVDGDRATLTVKLPNLDGGSITEVFMLYEDGGWRLDMPY